MQPIRFAGRQIPPQLIFLAHHQSKPAAVSVLAFPRDIAHDAGGARGRLNDSAQQFQRRCFASTVGSQEGDKLALFDLQIDPTNSGDFSEFSLEQSAYAAADPFAFLVNAVLLCQIADFNDRHELDLQEEVRLRSQKPAIVRTVCNPARRHPPSVNTLLRFPRKLGESVPNHLDSRRFARQAIKQFAGDWTRQHGQSVNVVRWTSRRGVDSKRLHVPAAIKWRFRTTDGLDSIVERAAHLSIPKSFANDDAFSRWQFSESKVTMSTLSNPNVQRDQNHGDQHPQRPSIRKIKQ